MADPRPPRGERDLLAPLARRLSCTEGQAWTLVVTVLLAILLAALTIPVAFR
ncbi:MAG TPA: hypothetical protein VGN54_02595 [Mycobacteriales bacterium]|jgi:hypothetical protein|nr:hypothetical protein [Mycobacteriales bacterium]